MARKSSRTVDFYRGGSYVGCGSYDDEAGLWEAYADGVPSGTFDKIEAKLKAGEDDGEVDGVSFGFRR